MSLGTVEWTKEKVENLLNEQTFDEQVTEEGLTKQQIEKIDFSEGLPDYVISLLKNTNSQITGTTIDPRKSLFENLRVFKQETTSLEPISSCLINLRLLHGILLLLFARILLCLCFFHFQ